jgi:shikimate kinase
MNKPEFTPHPDKAGPQSCVSIVGMAAAGKTTIGRELAALIGWPQIDTDNVIEATYGARLQRITDELDKEGFLDLEGEIVSRLNVRRCIVSTGGSVVYRDFAVQHLKSMGPIVYISVPLPIILERFARKPDRGMAMNPGQTIEELYAERVRLYEAAADFTIRGGRAPASAYARGIARWLAAEG